MVLSEVTMYQVCLLHSRAERVLKSYISAQLETWNITRMEWLLLATVHEKPKLAAGHTMGQVAETLDVRLSQVTALATKMNNGKLISQKVAKHDRRTRYLKITKRGEKLLEEIEAGMRKAMKAWLAGIPRDQLTAYMDTVRQLGSDMKQKSTSTELKKV